MSKELSMHYVCTLAEARTFASEHKDFYVSNCGCREMKGKCEQSRHDVCLYFNKDTGSSSGGKKKQITRKQLEEIFVEAENKNLVPRPFRNDDRSGTDGICFCCNDCCAYFLDRSEKCDKGNLIESTDMNECTHCGICRDVCFFGARIIKNDELKIISKNCYGCGLCVNTCPEECIRMIKRK